ncbi:hypothetical protein CKF54_05945, partial [Psittacicella hinzii]
QKAEQKVEQKVEEKETEVSSTAQGQDPEASPASTQTTQATAEVVPSETPASFEFDLPLVSTEESLAPLQLAEQELVQEPAQEEQTSAQVEQAPVQSQETPAQETQTLSLEAEDFVLPQMTSAPQQEVAQVAQEEKTSQASQATQVSQDNKTSATAEANPFATYTSLKQIIEDYQSFAPGLLPNKDVVKLLLNLFHFAGLTINEYKLLNRAVQLPVNEPQVEKDLGQQEAFALQTLPLVQELIAHPNMAPEWVKHFNHNPELSAYYAQLPQTQEFTTRISNCLEDFAQAYAKLEAAFETANPFVEKLRMENVASYLAGLEPTSPEVKAAIDSAKASYDFLVNFQKQHLTQEVYRQEELDELHCSFNNFRACIEVGQALQAINQQQNRFLQDFWVVVEDNYPFGGPSHSINIIMQCINKLKAINSRNSGLISKFIEYALTVIDNQIAYANYYAASIERKHYLQMNYAQHEVVLSRKLYALMQNYPTDRDLGLHDNLLDVVDKIVEKSNAASEKLKDLKVKDIRRLHRKLLDCEAETARVAEALFVTTAEGEVKVVLTNINSILKDYQERVASIQSHESIYAKVAELFGPHPGTGEIFAVKQSEIAIFALDLTLRCELFDHSHMSKSQRRRLFRLGLLPNQFSHEGTPVNTLAMVFEYLRDYPEFTSFLRERINLGQEGIEQLIAFNDKLLELQIEQEKQILADEITQDLQGLSARAKMFATTYPERAAQNRAYLEKLSAQAVTLDREICAEVDLANFVELVDFDPSWNLNLEAKDSSEVNETSEANEANEASEVNETVSSKAQEQAAQTAQVAQAPQVAPQVATAQTQGKQDAKESAPAVTSETEGEYTIDRLALVEQVANGEQPPAGEDWYQAHDFKLSLAMDHLAPEEQILSEKIAEAVAQAEEANQVSEQEDASVASATNAEASQTKASQTKASQAEASHEKAEQTAPATQEQEKAQADEQTQAQAQEEAREETQAQTSALEKSANSSVADKGSKAEQAKAKTQAQAEDAYADDDEDDMPGIPVLNYRSEQASRAFMQTRKASNEAAMYIASAFGNAASSSASSSATAQDQDANASTRASADNTSSKEARKSAAQEIASQEVSLATQLVQDVKSGNLPEYSQFAQLNAQEFNEVIVQVSSYSKQFTRTASQKVDQVLKQKNSLSQSLVLQRKRTKTIDDLLLEKDKLAGKKVNTSTLNSEIELLEAQCEESKAQEASLNARINLEDNKLAYAKLEQSKANKILELIKCLKTKNQVNFAKFSRQFVKAQNQQDEIHKGLKVWKDKVKAEEARVAKLTELVTTLEDKLPAEAKANVEVGSTKAKAKDKASKAQAVDSKADNKADAKAESKAETKASKESDNKGKSESKGADKGKGSKAEKADKASKAEKADKAKDTSKAKESPIDKDFKNLVSFSTNHKNFLRQLSKAENKLVKQEEKLAKAIADLKKFTGSNEEKATLGKERDSLRMSVNTMKNNVKKLETKISDLTKRAQSSLMNLQDAKDYINSLDKDAIFHLKYAYETFDIKPNKVALARINEYNKAKEANGKESKKAQAKDEKAVKESKGLLGSIKRIFTIFAKPKK